MLTVTEAAGSHLAQLLEKRDAQEGVAVRFVDDGQGITLRKDNERDGDIAFQHEGRTVLLLDAQVSKLLAEDTLDIVDAKLTLQHPTNK